MSGDLLVTRVIKAIICFGNSSLKNLFIGFPIHKTITESWLREFWRIEGNNPIKLMDLT
jgi:hypothetical protein